MEIMHEIDILLPAHVANSFLEEAVESVLASENIQVNLILVDTRSDEMQSQQPLLFANSNITVIRLPSGSYIEALSHGLNFARSEFLGLMNSDDLIDPKRFEKQINKIIETESDICICGIRKFHIFGKWLPSLSGKIDSEEFEKYFWLLGPSGADATWVLRREWAQQNEIFQSKYRNDWQLALSLPDSTKIVSVDEELYFYRQHPDQITRTNLEVQQSLIDSWKGLNQELNLPELSNAEIIAISMPWVRSNQIDSYSKISVWFISFMRLIENTRLRKSVKEVYNRRMIFALNIRNYSTFPVRSLRTLPKILIERVQIGKLIRK